MYLKLSIPIGYFFEGLMFQVSPLIGVLGLWHLDDSVYHFGESFGVLFYGNESVCDNHMILRLPLFFPFTFIIVPIKGYIVLLVNISNHIIFYPTPFNTN